jgi:hypothetical protein
MKPIVVLTPILALAITLIGAPQPHSQGAAPIFEGTPRY